MSIGNSSPKHDPPRQSRPRPVPGRSRGPGRPLRRRSACPVQGAPGRRPDRRGGQHRHPGAGAHRAGHRAGRLRPLRRRRLRPRPHPRLRPRRRPRPRPARRPVRPRTRRTPGADAASRPLYEAERIRAEPRRPNWTAAMVAAIVVVVGFVGFTLFSGSRRCGSQPVAGHASQDRPERPATRRATAPQPSADAPPPTPPPARPDSADRRRAGRQGRRQADRRRRQELGVGHRRRRQRASSRACCSRASPRPSPTTSRSPWSSATPAPSSCSSTARTSAPPAPTASWCVPTSPRATRRPAEPVRAAGPLGRRHRP